jgi:hypothetical protein
MNEPKVNIHDQSAEAGLAPPTPTKSIVASASKIRTFTAKDGRLVVTRWLSPLDRMKLFRALGSDLSSNQAYLSYAMICASVASIDGDACPIPANIREVEAFVQRLGDDLFDQLQELTVDTVTAVVAEREAAADAAKN